MSASTSSTHDLPYYVLVSHTPSGGNGSASSTTYSHPIIEYHYADDSPRGLLPRERGEHVIILDYTGFTDGPSTVKSLSSDLAAVGLKVTDAPGAATQEDGNTRNNEMFVIDTISLPEEMVDADQFDSAHAVLARFRQRNAILHKALEYGPPSAASTTDTAAPGLTNPALER